MDTCQVLSQVSSLKSTVLQCCSPALLHRLGALYAVLQVRLETNPLGGLLFAIDSG